MINIFEGSRRIAYLVGGGAVVITVLVAFNQTVYYRAEYSLDRPTASFRKSDGECKGKGKSLYLDHRTPTGEEVRVSICLESMIFTNKNMEKQELIPYKMDADGMIWGGSPYSSEVEAYEKQVEKRFTMSAADTEIAMKEKQKKWRAQFAEAMGYLAAGLAVFGATVWAVGWIVRGFLGIPSGVDKRPDS